MKTFTIVLLDIWNIQLKLPESRRLRILPEILALEWLSIGTFFRSECLKPRATETVQSRLLLTMWFLINNCFHISSPFVRWVNKR